MPIFGKRDVLHGSHSGVFRILIRCQPARLVYSFAKDRASPDAQNENGLLVMFRSEVGKKTIAASQVGDYCSDLLGLQVKHCALLNA